MTVRRACVNCGTEVDETAIFCPTCGQPIDEESEVGLPAAPAWPDPQRAERDEPGDAPAAAPEPDEPYQDDDRDVVTPADEPTRVEQRPPPPSAPPPGAAPRRPAASRQDERREPMQLPITMPVTLSAWLIGIGTAVAALGIVISLFDGFLNPIELLLLIALVAIAATIFFSTKLPAVPHLQLTTLVIVLIGFGMALDRIGFGGAGIGELLLFLGTAAAAIGAIILELGRDQPLGGPGRG